MIQPFPKRRRMHSTACRPRSVSVEMLPAFCEVPNREIHQDIRWTGIKSEHMGLRTTPPIDRGYVANPTEVVHAHVVSAYSKNHSMKQGGEGRALPAGS